MSTCSHGWEDRLLSDADQNCNLAAALVMKWSKVGGRNSDELKLSGQMVVGTGAVRRAQKEKVFAESGREG